MTARWWIGGLVVVLLVELVLAFLWFGFGMAENCNNGIPRWECSESLEEAVDVLLIAVPATYFTVFVIVALRASVQRRSGTPN
jgi:hypothetical protein